MINYPQNISRSGLTIYDPISTNGPDLFIPKDDLEFILRDSMSGLSLEGLPLRTRSKVVKQEICGFFDGAIPPYDNLSLNSVCTKNSAK